ncbi:MAG TPA: isoleucine--tRNA ligase [Kofleriaceae bacterium]
MTAETSSPKRLLHEPAKPDVRLSAIEERVLEKWDAEHTFEKSLAASASQQPYSFYDGPPFATGLPHYGNLLAGVLKDIVPRYWTMRGYHVARRFGWDCHGLPIEYEISKKLKIESNKQILAMGIDRYNAECRGIVQRYTQEWKASVRRIGRWVDMEHPYFTMDPSFMESVWWVFRQLWDKGLIYEGYKVLPYSTGVSTPLSNFEANLNYRDVQDPAITVAFQASGPDGDLPFALLAWTTTPWTLPSNLALAVRRDLAYSKVRDRASGKTYVLASALVDKYFDAAAIETVASMTGAELIGTTYRPLFPYFASTPNAFRVIHADHVSIDAGTGLVHMAPAFGEEDFIACQKHDIPIVNPVDDDGMFTAEVPDFAGQRVKDADRDIIQRLKDDGRIFRHETITHSYPFCWRSNTPLIYRAVSTWFVRVEAIKDQILAGNRETTWVPDHLRDGRFGKWLENARDWAVSRNRFWGTPLPIWKNDQGETVCIGSIEQLEQLTGQPVTDLHLDAVARLEIPSANGGSPLRQYGGVLDCWFESGAMPYAQHGYPRTQKAEFEASFPADFIAEGLDQTRGWFYTLTVIGNALFGKSPFKNVVVNGLLLAEDGKKMSKSLRNYPDPQLLFDEHGADALRLYLVASPAVKAQEVQFSEKGVRDVVRKILLRWWNAYSFYVSYANIEVFEPRGIMARSPNVLDRWILSRLNSLIENTNREMEAYKLYNVVPNLLQFIEELTNTYIRLNRPQFWADGMPEAKRQAFETLFHVLHTLAKVMAPFTPFLSEATYGNLSRVLPGAKDSVHLEAFPEAELARVDRELEDAVARMSQMVVMARNIRETIGVKAKIPLQRLTIIHRERRVLDAMRLLEGCFVEELNVDEVVYEDREDDWIQISAKANFKKLGARLGKQMKPVANAVQRLTVADIVALEAGRTIELEGERIALDDVEIRRAPKDGNQALASDQLISIALDPTVTEAQIRTGLSREVIRRIQVARKNANLVLDDRIEVQLACDAELRGAIEAHDARIREATLSTTLALVDVPGGTFIEDAEIDGRKLTIGLRVDHGARATLHSPRPQP